MTTEEQKLSRSLIITPPQGHSTISKEEFLGRFPSAVEHGKLALRLLEEASREKNSEDLLCALVIGATFGFGREHTDILCHLLDADWHFNHEDVVSALDMLRAPEAVDAFFHATQWVPKYLNYDENRALALKAIWALGNITDAKADQKLEMLTRSDDSILRKNAAYQVSRRHKPT